MPYKLHEKKHAYDRKYMTKLYQLEKLRSLDNNSMILSLAYCDENGEVPSRIVSVELETRKIAIHLSPIAIDMDKYVNLLKSLKFPLKVEFGGIYTVRKATPEQAEKIVADRTGFYAYVIRCLELHLQEVQQLQKRQVNQILSAIREVK